MMLLISAFWLIPAFIIGGLISIIALAIFSAKDIDLPKQTGRLEMDESEKFYHSQPIRKFKGVIKN